MNSKRNSYFILLASAIIIPFVQSCRSSFTKPTYKSAELYFKMDIYNTEDNELYSYQDSIHLTESEKNTLLYTITKPFETVYVQTDKEGNIKNQTLVKSGNSNNYFFCKKGVQYGVLYDSLHVKGYKLMNADSFINRKISFRSEMFHSENDSLISAVKNRGKTTEVYIPKIKKDNSYPDTLILVFSEMKVGMINYSLAPALDSIKKMKLQKAVFISNPMHSEGKSSHIIPRREIILELRNSIATPVSKEILNLFEMAESILKN